MEKIFKIRYMSSKLIVKHPECGEFSIEALETAVRLAFWFGPTNSGSWTVPM
jgi:hypothetical protein